MNVIFHEFERKNQKRAGGLPACSRVLHAGGMAALLFAGVGTRAQPASSPEIATPAITMPVPDDITPAKKPQSSKWTFSFLPVAFQKNPLLDFTVLTEMTDYGRKLPPPSFKRPVYYMSFSNGQQDKGPGYGGKNAMAFEQLDKRLLQALASAGYRPSDKEHPATQVLIFTWGEHNRVDMLTNTDEDGTTAKNRYGVDSSNFDNLMSRAHLVGGKQFAEELAQALKDQALMGGTGIHSPLERFKERNTLTSSLVDQVFDDCYYVVVSAYDLLALAGPLREKRLLWRTRMSTAAQGVSLEQTMPGMLENGAYYFGREMKAPEIIIKRIMREGKVEIGEATVQEYITGTNVAPAGSGTATKDNPRNNTK